MRVKNWIHAFLQFVSAKHASVTSIKIRTRFVDFSVPGRWHCSNWLTLAQLKIYLQAKRKYINLSLPLLCILFPVLTLIRLFNTESMFLSTRQIILYPMLEKKAWLMRTQSSFRRQEFANALLFGLSFILIKTACLLLVKKQADVLFLFLFSSFFVCNFTSNRIHWLDHQIGSFKICGLILHFRRESPVKDSWKRKEKY